MAERVAIPIPKRTNYLSFELDDTINGDTEKFRPWVTFLTQHSMVRYALLTAIPLDAEMLGDFYRTAVFTISRGSISVTCTIGGETLTVTDRDVNTILHFPTDDLVELPNFQTLKQFFQTRGYMEEIKKKTVKQSKFPAEWSYFTINISNCFSKKSEAFHNYSIPVQQIMYAVANNAPINIGKLILQELSKSMGPLEDRNTHCYYPRFLMLILKDKLSPITFASFTGPKVSCHALTSYSLKRIANKHPNTRAFFTDYMLQVLGLQNQPAQAALSNAPVAQPVEAPVQVTLNTEVQATIKITQEAQSVEASVLETLNKVRDTSTSAILAQPSVAEVSQNYSLVNSPMATQVPLPQTLIPKSNAHGRYKKIAAKSVRPPGATVLATANKGDNLSGPAAPTSKRRKVLSNRSSPTSSESSQQDSHSEKANTSNLGSASQQVVPIEICPTVGVPVSEFAPLVAGLIAIFSAQMRDAHTGGSSAVPATVTEDSLLHNEGGFRIRADSGISSPVLMELDHSTGDRNDLQLIVNDSTIVDETLEVPRTSEKKQNKMSGEGEMSGKECQSLGLDAYEKKRERSSEIPIPQSPTKSVPVSSPIRSDKDVPLPSEPAQGGSENVSLATNLKSVLSKAQHIREEVDIGFLYMHDGFKRMDAGMKTVEDLHQRVGKGWEQTTSQLHELKGASNYISENVADIKEIRDTVSSFKANINQLEAQMFQLVKETGGNMDEMKQRMDKQDAVLNRQDAMLRQILSLVSGKSVTHSSSAQPDNTTRGE